MDTTRLSHDPKPTPDQFLHATSICRSYSWRCWRRGRALRAESGDAERKPALCKHLRGAGCCMWLCGTGQRSVWSLLTGAVLDTTTQSRVHLISPHICIYSWPIWLLTCIRISAWVQKREVALVHYSSYMYGAQLPRNRKLGAHF